MKKRYLLKAIFLIVFFTHAFGMGLNAFAEYEKESALFSLDFEGDDDTSIFMWTNDNKTVEDPNINTVGGVAELDKNTFSNRAPVIKLNTPIDVSKTTNLYFEARFKQNKNTTLSAGKALFKWTGSTGNYFASVYCYGGKLYYGKGNSDNANNSSLKTDYEIFGNEWYTLRMHIYNNEKKISVEVIPDSEDLAVYDEKYAQEHGYEYKQPLMWYNLDCLTSINLPYTADFGSISLDYIHIWDEDFKIKSASIENGESEVSADSDFSVSFTGVPNERSLENIYVRDSKNNNVPYELEIDGKTVNLFFTAGLKYDESYSVTLPNTITDENGECIREKTYEFTTEKPLLFIDKPETSISDGKASTSVYIKNTSSYDKEICILNVLYDADGKVMKMTNESFTVSSGEEKTIVSVTEAEGAETVKGYLWDGMNMSK